MRQVPTASTAAKPATVALKREVTPFQSFAVAFGFVSIATGIFSAYGAMLATSGPMGIWTWPVATLGQFLVALILGSFAARIPVTGYAYQWVSRITNPIFGWVMGWISFTFLVVVLCAVDYTVAATVFPPLFGYTNSVGATWLVTAVVIALQGLLIAASTSLTQRLNAVAVLVQLIGMLGLVALLFGVGYTADKLNFANLWSTAPILADGYFSLGTATKAGPWVMGMLLGAFTIVGFESAANLAEETENPATVVPRAMWQAVLSLGIVGMLFLIAVTALLDTSGLHQISETPIADVITGTLGTSLGKMLLVLVAISIFSCGLVILLSASRLVWAMSRDERFPGWKRLKVVSATRGTPVNATLLVTVVGQTILAAFSQQTDALFSLFAAATLLPAIIYTACILVYMYRRDDLPPSQGFRLGKWETPVLWLALAWLLFELAIFRDASFAKPWMYVALMLAIGLAYLAVLLIRGGAAGMKMPENIAIDAVMDAQQGTKA